MDKYKLDYLSSRYWERRSRQVGETAGLGSCLPLLFEAVEQLSAAHRSRVSLIT